MSGPHLELRGQPQVDDGPSNVEGRRIQMLLRAKFRNPPRRAGLPQIGAEG